MDQNRDKTLLFLDDTRNPLSHEPGCQNWLIFSPIDLPFKTVWVKSYDEFTLWITKNGLPDGICFDHDLGYDIVLEKMSTGMSKTKAQKERRGTKTGMDCAKWLVEYCLDNKLPLPPYNIQSANPAGKENIDGLLKSFNKSVTF